MKLLSSPSFSGANGCARRGGFTLVEILVAVAIMSLLLAIILVPLRLGFETYHIGTARAGLQQEMQLTMQQMNKDFLRADFVFPNTRVSGISDNTIDTTSACSLQPYKSDNTGSATDWKYLPYFRANVAPAAGTSTDPYPAANGIGITNNSIKPKAFANPSRIDMLFLRRSKSGVASSAGEDYVVTYYPRRLDISQPYDVIDNPIVLFRAQYPYRHLETSGFKPQTAPDNASAFNARTDWTQYPPTLGTSASDTPTDRSYKWITHNYFGEANLEPLCVDVDKNPTGTPPVAEDVVGSHTLVTPRGMQLVAPSATSGNAGAFIPELSFVEGSSDGKRIDRVTVNMTLAQYDQAGAASVNGQGKAQRVPVTQTFDLPNASCSN